MLYRREQMDDWNKANGNQKKDAIHTHTHNRKEEEEKKKMKREALYIISGFMSDRLSWRQPREEHRRADSRKLRTHNSYSIPPMAYTVAKGLTCTFFFSFFSSGLWASPHISFISSEWTGCPLPIHGELVTGLRHPGLNKLQEKYRAEEKSGQQRKKKKL